MSGARLGAAGLAPDGNHHRRRPLDRSGFDAGSEPVAVREHVKGAILVLVLSETGRQTDSAPALTNKGEGTHL
jgi:hypothetical protein